MVDLPQSALFFRADVVHLEIYRGIAPRAPPEDSLEGDVTNSGFGFYA